MCDDGMGRQKLLGLMGLMSDLNYLNFLLQNISFFEQKINSNMHCYFKKKNTQQLNIISLFIFVLNK